MLVLNSSLVFLRTFIRDSDSGWSYRKRTLIRWTALTLSSGVKNHAFVGESGNRKLLDVERVIESRDVKGAHKKSPAVTRVIIPVMIISLEESQSELRVGKRSNLVVPLPWFKSSGADVQRAEADEARDNLSCKSHECLRGSVETAFQPVPFIKTVRG